MVEIDDSPFMLMNIPEEGWNTIDEIPTVTYNPNIEWYESDLLLLYVKQVGYRFGEYRIHTRDPNNPPRVLGKGRWSIHGCTGGFEILGWRYLPEVPGEWKKGVRE